MLGEKPVAPTPPMTAAEEAEAARQFEEELYWEDYWDRNRDDKPQKGTAETKAPTSTIDPHCTITDEDVPF